MGKSHLTLSLSFYLASHQITLEHTQQIAIFKGILFSYEDLGQLNFSQYHRCSLCFSLKLQRPDVFGLSHCKCST